MWLSAWLSLLAFMPTCHMQRRSAHLCCAPRNASFEEMRTWDRSLDGCSQGHLYAFELPLESVFAETFRCCTVQLSRGRLRLCPSHHGAHRYHCILSCMPGSERAVRVYEERTRLPAFLVPVCGPRPQSDIQVQITDTLHLYPYFESLRHVETQS